MRVVILGAGGHGRVVRAAAEAGDLFEVVAFYDDNAALHGTTVDGVIVAGAISEFDGSDGLAVIGIGNNQARFRVAKAMPVDYASVVHPSSSVDGSVDLASGTVVFAGAVVQCGSILGEHAVVNTSASVDHDSAVGSFAHIGPGAVLTGSVVVGDGAFVGAGSTINPGLAIGSWATVGAGAAVVADVAASTTVGGVPARLLERDVS